MAVTAVVAAVAAAIDYCYCLGYYYMRSTRNFYCCCCSMADYIVVVVVVVGCNESSSRRSMAAIAPFGDCCFELVAVAVVGEGFELSHFPDLLWLLVFAVAAVVGFFNHYFREYVFVTIL